MFDKNELFIAESRDKIYPFKPKVDKKAVSILIVLFTAISAYFGLIIGFTIDAAKVEWIDIAVLPNMRIEAVVISIIGIGIIAAYLRNPNDYKNCPYTRKMWAIYIPVTIALVLFVRYAIMLATILCNIPDFTNGIKTPFVVFYDSNNTVLLSILVYHEIIFLIIGEIALAEVMWIFINMYKDIGGVCSAIEKPNGEKITWKGDGFTASLTCKPYKDSKKVCKINP